MENSNVSPISENEMNTFFSRLSSQFVGLSAQAEQLKVLSEDMKGLTAKLDGLSQDLDRERQYVQSLRTQIDTLVAERDNARNDAKEGWNTAESYARERDAKVVEIEKHVATISSIKQELSLTYDALAHANDTIRDKDVAIAELNKIVQSNAREAEWSNAIKERQAKTIEDQNDRIRELMAKLDKVRAVITEQAAAAVTDEAMSLSQG